MENELTAEDREQIQNQITEYKHLTNNVPKIIKNLLWVVVRNNHSPLPMFSLGNLAAKRVTTEPRQKMC